MFEYITSILRLIHPKYAKFIVEKIIDHCVPLSYVEVSKICSHCGLTYKCILLCVYNIHVWLWVWVCIPPLAYFLKGYGQGIVYNTLAVQKNLVCNVKIY